MDINLQTGKTMKQVCQLTALAAALALAGCGGGGGGFYGGSTTTASGTGTTGTGTTATVATNYHIILNTNKPTMVVSGDTAVITEKLVDVNGGGVAGQTISLSIKDTQTNGVTIVGPSSGLTDANGNVQFTVNLPTTTGAAATALIASGIVLNGSFTDTAGKSIGQTTTINVAEALTASTSTAQYHLTMTPNKPAMVVTGDVVIITVKAVDTNGGGVGNQNVVLSIPDTLTNNVTITGSSTATTDETGVATYSITLPSVPAAQQAALIAKGIVVNASLTDVNGVTTKQSTQLNVVPTAVVVPVANITFGNSAQEATSSDGTYYTESVSANVVGVDGKPIAFQPVVMSIDKMNFGKGQYFYYAIDPDPKQWHPQFQSVVQTVDAAGNPVLDTSGNPKYHFEYTNTTIRCTYTNQSFVQTPTTFVGAAASTDGTVTYTTDATGKFDFQIRYLRRYANWQTVDIKATAKVAGTTVFADLTYDLVPTVEDSRAEGGQPWVISPYGTGSDCSNTN